jgi:uncharacterized membrane protein YtjA (UPF0391 family)
MLRLTVLFLLVAILAVATGFYGVAGMRSFPSPVCSWRSWSF